jgi:hypothetical protein
MLDALNHYYSPIVTHLEAVGVHGSIAWREESAAVPFPATLTIELGQEITRRSSLGMEVRLYSDHPFRSRRNGGPRDDFERTALASLRREPERPVYRFEELRGSPVLRYATARRMTASCVDCHNSHGESTKTDWKVGDVRGVVEIIRPLDADVARIRRGLQGTFFLVGCVGAGLLALSGLILSARPPSAPASGR